MNQYGFGTVNTRQLFGVLIQAYQDEERDVKLLLNQFEILNHREELRNSQN